MKESSWSCLRFSIQICQQRCMHTRDVRDIWRVWDDRDLSPGLIGVRVPGSVRFLMIFRLKQSMIHPVQQLASHDFLWIRLILSDPRGITPVLGPQLRKFHGWGGLCGPRKRPSQFPRSQWDRGGRCQRSPNLHTPSGSHERRRHFIRRGVPFRVLSFGSMDACPLQGEANLSLTGPFSGRSRS